MEYQRRIIDDELEMLFPSVPAIALDGAKAVGKTTTAAQHVASAVRLDSEATRLITAADPESILPRPRPLLIDEWQRVPPVWDVVRRAVDDDPRGRSFLLTGSASPVEGATAHSGAGRIGRLRMRPMSLAERGLGPATVGLVDLLAGSRPKLSGESGLRLADYAHEIVASGFPALRRLPPAALRFQLDSYLHNIVDRDIAEHGLVVRKPAVLLSWMRAYAAATAGTAGYAAILDAATPGEGDKPSRSTVTSYRDVLTRLWLIDPVPAWLPTGSDLARLGRSPKHHLADPALACRLLGLTAEMLIDGSGTPLGGGPDTMLGHLFESLGTLCVRVAAQAAGATVGHVRTRGGEHEVDLVVVRDDGCVVAVEFKLAAAITDRDTAHLSWLRDRLGPRLLDAMVVNTGPEAYRRRDGIGVVPLALLGGGVTR